jgi:hypothetical protein
VMRIGALSRLVRRTARPALAPEKRCSTSHRQ